MYCVAKPIMAIVFAFAIGAFVQKDLGSALILAFVCMVLFFITPSAYIL
ncbi:MAG: hypothetical protein ACLSBH_22030 [Coprobacillus cateniformis]